MSIWSKIKEWANKPATPQTLRWVDAKNVKTRDGQPPYVDVEAKSDETYIRIWLVEMGLGQTRTWFKDYQPTVQALTTLRFGDQSPELPRIAATDKSRYAQGKSVLQNYPLLDLVPFRGGTVEFEAGLVAIKGDDQLANGIKALSKVASLFSAPLAGAIAAASKVKESADLLVGDDAGVVLAYHNTFTAQKANNQLRCGYLAIVCEDPAKLDNYEPVVDVDELRLWDRTTNAVQPVGRDYMLLRFEILPNRDDLRAFSDIQKLRDDTINAFVKDGNDAGDRAYRAALAKILTHPELIHSDRKVLMAELKADCDPLRSGSSAAVGSKPRTWNEFVEQLPNSNDNAAPVMSEFYFDS